jgi:hypothetical protein
MNLKHTPGPWRMSAAIRPDEFDIRDAKSSGGFAPIAKVRGDKRHTLEQAAANARLIAAAPELLDALMTVPQGMLWSDDDLWRWNDKARAAIAKATGGEA